MTSVLATFYLQGMNSVLNTLRNVGTLTEENLSLIAAKLKVFHREKGNVLLAEGEICRSLYFLMDGSVLQMQNVGETEVTTNLITENTWFFDQQSFVGQKPSTTSIICFEPCNLVSLDIDAIHELIAQSQIFFQLGRLFPIAGGSRDSDFHRISPDEKYQRLLFENPKAIQKFPLHNIASYLQITPETLSRVRKKLSVEELS